MLYPDDDTATSVSGKIGRQAGSTSVILSWAEHRARRAIEFDGSYVATITGDQMKADWRRGDKIVAQFEMTPADR